MDSKIISNSEIAMTERIKSKITIENIKSKYILEKILNILQTNKFLNIIKYNKRIHQRLDINIKNYQEYSQIYSSIEIEIIPVKNVYTKIIHINNDEDEKYFHIYFDNNKKEINKLYLKKEDNVSKINIKIVHLITSFSKLFYLCSGIESIIFKKFYRINITDMGNMFCGCTSLKEIKFSKIQVM